MRRPGRRTGPKKRSALDAIGIFQEIHVDGHEKLGEKGLKMGAGIGIDVYGARDHVGKILWLIVVPNARLSDTIGHVFLDMVSELGWLAAFQTTLRYVNSALGVNDSLIHLANRQEFAPRLSVVEWPPTVSVKSTSNISIESAWSYDRNFNGRSLREILEDDFRSKLIIYVLLALGHCLG
ncbi:hypothetical protein R3P38DRAFT_2575599 [Favolaschia claudopus]|uniref:Uncharacterized protein n=1 Tax=Favolaschia claudopus TaxID=2862362 RepID=A0AAV9ZKF8_9AGAR